jgi:hypothetical protein
MDAHDFAGIATLVGSSPHTDAEPLVKSMLERFPAVPAWPQLPARDIRESMYVQYAEGLPGAVVDLERQRIFFRQDEAFTGALEPFYQAVVEGDVGRFATNCKKCGYSTCLAFAMKLVTTNFSLTCFSVSTELDAAGLPSHLAVVDTEGLSVLTAWAAGRFSGEHVATALCEMGATEKVGHETVVIPGCAAAISGELEDALGAGWRVLTGPQEAADIAPFLRDVWSATAGGGA